MCYIAAMQHLAMAFQCAASFVTGGFVYYLLWPDPNPKVPLFGGLIVGFAVGWAVMFLWTWMRWGWRAARSMSMEP